MREPLRIGKLKIMIYLLLGEDSLAKDQRIAEIKEKTLNTPEALKFDYEVLHADKLDRDILKQALIALPAVAKKRLIVLRTIQKLSPHNKKIILEFLETIDDRIVFILDADDANLKNSFITKVSAKAKVQKFPKGAKQNVFDMTRAMSARDPVEVFTILSELLSDGIHPLQILGGLIWYWGNTRNRMSADRFKKGLLILQEADLNIKRSRLKPEYAIEVLVTKLISL